MEIDNSTLKAHSSRSTIPINPVTEATTHGLGNLTPCHIDLISFITSFLHIRDTTHLLSANKFLSEKIGLTKESLTTTGEAYVKEAKESVRQLRGVGQQVEGLISIATLERQAGLREASAITLKEANSLVRPDDTHQHWPELLANVLSEAAHHDDQVESVFNRLPLLSDHPYVYDQVMIELLVAQARQNRGESCLDRLIDQHQSYDYSDEHSTDSVSENSNLSSLMDNFRFGMAAHTATRKLIDAGECLAARSIHHPYLKEAHSIDTEIQVAEKLFSLGDREAAMQSCRRVSEWLQTRYLPGSDDSNDDLAWQFLKMLINSKQAEEAYQALTFLIELEDQHAPIEDPNRQQRLNKLNRECIRLIRLSGELGLDDQGLSLLDTIRPTTALSSARVLDGILQLAANQILLQAHPDPSLSSDPFLYWSTIIRRAANSAEEESQYFNALILIKEAIPNTGPIRDILMLFEQEGLKSFKDTLCSDIASMLAQRGYADAAILFAIEHTGTYTHALTIKSTIEQIASHCTHEALDAMIESIYTPTSLRRPYYTIANLLRHSIETFSSSGQYDLAEKVFEKQNLFFNQRAISHQSKTRATILFSNMIKRGDHEKVIDAIQSNNHYLSQDEKLSVAKEMVMSEHLNRPAQRWATETIAAISGNFTIVFNNGDRASREAPIFQSASFVAATQEALISRARIGINYLMQASAMPPLNPNPL